jgi:trigger factor
VVSDVNFKSDQPLRFKASVEVRPQIRLPDKLEFQITRQDVRISDSDVQQSLDELRERHATVVPSEGPVEETDIVIVDTWKVDQAGVPIVGQKAADYPIDIGSPQVMPEYKQALVGAVIGDQKRVRVTYPPEHPQKELAGQEASFLLQVKEIKNKTLPPLEDEFAKSISDYPTLQALKDAIRENLQEQGEQRARRDMEEQIIDQIIEQSSFEVPESMVGGYVEALISDLRSESHQKEDLDQLRSSFRPLATRQVRRWFILEEVQKKEGIQVDENELAAKVAALAQARGIKSQKLHQQLASTGQLQKLRHSMEEEKTLSFLVDKAQIKIAPAQAKE